MGTDIFDKYRTDPQIKQIFIGADVSTLNTEFLSSSLKSIQVESGNKNFCVENNILMNKKKTKIIATGTPEKGIFTVPSTVKQIDFTYINKGEISEIRVEDGNSAFYIKDNCLHKKTDNAKDETLCLSPITATSAAITISSQSDLYLSGNDKITEITIDKNCSMKGWTEGYRTYDEVIYIDNDAAASANLFNKHFPNLKSIKVEEGNSYFSAKDGILYSKDGSMLIYYNGSVVKTKI